MAQIDKSHEAADVNDNVTDHENDVSLPQCDGDAGVRVVVLDFSAVTFVDSTAAVALKKIYAAYRKLGVQLIFSGCAARVTAVMAASRLPGDDEGRVELYPTVHDAVMAVC